MGLDVEDVEDVKDVEDVDCKDGKDGKDGKEWEEMETTEKMEGSLGELDNAVERHPCGPPSARGDEDGLSEATREQPSDVGTVGIRSPCSHTDTRELYDEEGEEKGEKKGDGDRIARGEPEEPEDGLGEATRKQLSDAGTRPACLHTDTLELLDEKGEEGDEGDADGDEDGDEPLKPPYVAL